MDSFWKNEWIALMFIIKVCNQCVLPGITSTVNSRITRKSSDCTQKYVKVNIRWKDNLVYYCGADDE